MDPANKTSFICSNCTQAKLIISSCERSSSEKKYQQILTQTIFMSATSVLQLTLSRLLYLRQCSYSYLYMEGNVTELQENRKEMFSQYYLQSDAFSRSSTTK